MKKTLTPIAIVILFTIGLLSCSKSSNSSEIIIYPLSATVNDLMADTILGYDQGRPYGAGKFTFYSLENNAPVPNSDSATNKWDIAFRSTTILTNAGTSGPGLGGAFIYNGLFNDLITIPTDSTFATDNAPANNPSPSYAIKTGSGKGWYTYDGQTNIITPLAGRVLVIKTATGKYAKVEIISYYKGGVTLGSTASDEEKSSKQRYYTFRYVFQPNGTKTF